MNHKFKNYIYKYIIMIIMIIFMFSLIHTIFHVATSHTIFTNGVVRLPYRAAQMDLGVAGEGCRPAAFAISPTNLVTRNFLNNFSPFLRQKAFAQSEFKTPICDCSLDSLQFLLTVQIKGYLQINTYIHAYIYVYI